MNFGLSPMRAVWAAVLLAAAMLAFAPSGAEAHAGHSHARAATSVQQPSLASVAVVAKATQNLTAAPSVPSPLSADADCDGKGCCASGPCTGCHGVVLTTLPVTLPPTFSTLLVAQDTQPRGSPDVGRLRRPPKSFA